MLELAPKAPPSWPRKKTRTTWAWGIVRRALVDSFLKLNPRHMMRNPVMFVVEVGSVITTFLLFPGGKQSGFDLQITIWLWFTVLFANFAEAMAEGRGKAQADSLRKARSETMANRLLSGGRTEKVPGSKLRTGDVVVVSAGELLVRPIRTSAERYTHMQAFLTDYPHLTVLAADLAIAAQAASIRAMTRMKLADAFIVATGLLSGCEAIIHNDERWKGMAALLPQFRWIYLNDYV